MRDFQTGIMSHPHDPVSIFKAWGGDIQHNSANATPMRCWDYSAHTNFENTGYIDEGDIEMGMASTPEGAAWDALHELQTIDRQKRELV